VPLAQAAFAPKRHIVVQEHPKVYAHRQLMDEKQFICLDNLWTQESHWNPKALNKISGAFGIAQFMPTTWANYNMPYKPKNPILQVKYGLHYISKRYLTPCRAWIHEQRYGWY